MANKLEEVEAGKTKRIMFFLPPRHSKSMTITETFPSWYIGRKPNRLVIEISYNNTFAKKFGRRNREKINRKGNDIFGSKLRDIRNDDSLEIKVSPEQRSATDWALDGYRGQMLSSGVGGTITGEGADLLIIDDPIKNRQEAYSEVYRERLWGEYDATLRSRLQAGGAIILIMTRWHEDDLAGRILKEEGDQWEVVKLPAICETPKEDILGREKGEALWPEGGYDKKEMEKRKKNTDIKTWASLYQQDPSPEEGNIIKKKWWKYYSRLPRLRNFDKIIQSWDCAFKDKQDNSYVVCEIWGKLGPDVFLLDISRNHLDFTQTLKELESMSKRWPQASAKYIEDTANGPAVMNVMKSRMSGMIPTSVEGSKADRVHAITPYLESGNVYLPEGKDWVKPFINECAKFPDGKFDDQVDAFSQAVSKLLLGKDLSPSDKKPHGF